MHTLAQKSRQTMLPKPAVPDLAPVRSLPLSEAQGSAPAGFDFSRIPAHAPDQGAQQRAGATFGLSPDAGQDEIVFGRTVGEVLGDVGRPVGTAVGNVIGGIAGLLTGVDISSNDTSPAVWSPDGSFSWHVGFTTGGRSGWIVQDLNLDWRGTDAAGATIPGSPLFPHFLEAWDVNAAGSVNPRVGATNDMWMNPRPARLPAPFNTAVGGHWSASSSVHFTTVDPATQGFIRKNPRTHSASLLSSVTAPAGLNLSMARLHRYAQGHWDSTTPHTGSAG